MPHISCAPLASQMTELEEHFKKREAELEGQIQTLQAEHLEVQEDLEEERFVSAALRCAEDVVAQHAASLADEVHRFEDFLIPASSFIVCQCLHLCSLFLMVSLEAELVELPECSMNHSAGVR